MIPDDIERVALLGWRLYPASRYTKAACIKNGSDLASCDLNVLASWCEEFPRCNWRVVCSGSGIWGLDLDVPPGHAQDGIANFGALVRVHGPIPKRPTLRSGGGGAAIFFQDTGNRIIGESGHPCPGVDPRRGRQSQTIPPSLHHATKRPYRWITPPWQVAPPPAPAWLLRLLEPPAPPPWKYAPIDTSDVARNSLVRASYAVATALPGDRNAALNRRSYQMGRMVAEGLLGSQEVIDALYGAARMAGLDHAEIAATIKSGMESVARRVSS